MPDYSRIGRRSRTKGNRFERKVANELSHLFGMRFQRTPCSGGSFIPGDITRTDGHFHLEIECKDRKTIDIDKIFRNPNLLKQYLHPRRLLIFNDEGSIYGVVARVHVMHGGDAGMVEVAGLITSDEVEYLLLPIHRLTGLHTCLFEKI